MVVQPGSHIAPGGADGQPGDVEHAGVDLGGVVAVCGGAT